MTSSNHVMLTGGSRKKKVKYSKNQVLLFSFMPKNGERITSTELTKKLVNKRRRTKVENPRNLVISTMRYGLIKKVNSCENFRINATRQHGPYPIEYWIVRK